MDNRPLKVKALEVAIKDIKMSMSRETANATFKRWEVFRNEPSFKRAIQEKKEEFNQWSELTKRK